MRADFKHYAADSSFVDKSSSARRENGQDDVNSYYHFPGPEAGRTIVIGVGGDGLEPPTSCV
jgi:hypothetical protein